MPTTPLSKINRDLDATAWTITIMVMLIGAMHLFVFVMHAFGIGVK
jgi:hypothetical protein